jgi:putative endonuclease
MFYVYILYSPSLDKFYIGHTKNLEDTLRRHNTHRSRLRKFTKRASDWKLVYFEIFEEKTKAIKMEKEIKRKKSRNYIEKLISFDKISIKVG